MTTRQYSPIRGVKLIAAISAATLLTLGFTAPAIAAPGSYTALDLDLTEGIPAGWSVSGSPAIDDVFEFSQNGLAWQGIPVDETVASSPHVGDEVHGEVDLTLWGDVTASDTVLLRLTDGRKALTEWKDLTSLPRGERITVATAAIDATPVLDADTTHLMVELHNDTTGTVDVSTLRLWGVRDGEHIDYTVPGADFGPADGIWNGEKTTPKRELVLGASDALTTTIPVGTDDGLRVGDTVTATARVAHDGGAPAIFATIDATSAESPAADTWSTVTNDVVDVAGSVTGTLRGDEAPVRIRSFTVTGERGDPVGDVNGDGTVNSADLTALQDLIAGGSTDLAYDFDRDGGISRADADAFARFVLDDESVVFPSLRHLDFLSEDFVIDGHDMTITHLYAEPDDRSDLSAGYHWVGDPQEGIAALDDVARSAIVYAEHYALYGDAHSYEQLAGNLEFVLWMRTSDSLYDNFVVTDGAGGLATKDSASSHASFGYWAARAYEALATARPLLEDGDLADRVDAALAGTLDRLATLLASPATDDGGDGLRSDLWLQTIAVNAAAVHHEIATDAQRATIETVLETLGGNLADAQSGDFTTSQLGAIRNSAGTWDEWGSVQTQALARAATITGNDAWLAAARLSADSFLSDLLISGRSATVGPNKNAGTQINYGTASYVENYLTLFEITGDRAYADMAGVAATWWLGNNRLGTAMFDQTTGVAFDAINANGLNSNGGAESVVEALRAILRVSQVPEARAMMTASLVETVGTTTYEFEDLARQGRPDDAPLTLPQGGLDDPATAVRTQEADTGTDEAGVYADSLAFDANGAVYGAWTGRNSLFVAGDGYNNMRLFDGGTLTRDVPLADLGDVAEGDTLSLAFAANVQFSTTLHATVEAIVPGSEPALLADDSGFAYHPRTWYSGASKVRTTAVAPIPAGTTTIRITFAVDAAATHPYEGYASLAEAELSVLGAPDVRFGSSAFSANAYARLLAGSSHAYEINVPEAGEANVFLSTSADSDGGRADAGLLAITTPVALSGFFANIDTSGEVGSVDIRNLGVASLNDGPATLSVSISPETAASLDALIVYPVRTSATYRLLDGTERMVLRDAGTQTLRSGTPDELAAPLEPTPEPSTEPTSEPSAEPSTEPTTAAPSAGTTPATPAPTRTSGLAATGTEPTLGWALAGAVLLAAGVLAARWKSRRRAS